MESAMLNLNDMPFDAAVSVVVALLKSGAYTVESPAIKRFLRCNANTIITIGGGLVNENN